MKIAYITLEQVKSALETAARPSEFLGRFAAYSNGNNGLLRWY